MMEFHGGGAAAVLSGSNVPAFLTKLWTLVEDPDTDPLICWSKVQKLAWFSPARRSSAGWLHFGQASELLLHSESLGERVVYVPAVQTAPVARSCGTACDG